MSDSEREAGYVEGRRRAYIDLLHYAAEKLGYKDPLAKAAALITEREEAVQALRDICERYGDNDWKNNLHLRDIINKHLGDHLDDSEAASGWIAHKPGCGTAARGCVPDCPDYDPRFDGPGGGR